MKVKRVMVIYEDNTTKVFDTFLLTVMLPESERKDDLITAGTVVADTDEDMLCLVANTLKLAAENICEICPKSPD